MAQITLVEAVNLALQRAMQDDEIDPHRLSQTIRRTVGKWVSDTHRRRPMIIPVVIEA